MCSRTQSKYVLSCESLHFEIGLKSILSGINLCVPSGAVVGLIGSNGAGKSTLLRCMAGLAVPTQGEVRLFNTPALQINDSIRERIGFVAQSPSLFAWMTVENHIRFIGQTYPNWNERHALELALFFCLPMSRIVSKLSGGDQQKLAVVLALAHRPDLILLDEPVSNLDPTARRDFMNSLFNIRNLNDVNYSERVNEAQIDNNKLTYAPTIVISSHLLSDLERAVSHVAFMRSGKIQLFESWKIIRNNIHLVATDTGLLQAPLCIAQNDQNQVVDLRNIAQANSLSDEQRKRIIELARPIESLDELFVALNS